MNMPINQSSLIPVVEMDIGGEVQPCVDARELHKWLKSGEMFSKWIVGRIKKYGFDENQDYVCYWEFSQTQTKTGRKGKAKVKTYALSLDMAKELSMVENNDQGRMARRYFINCEKALRQSAYGLLNQFNKAMLEFEKLTDIASNAGRTLRMVGRKYKPEAKQKVDDLKNKINPLLPLEWKDNPEDEE